jgi:tRNA threonylcarbamoyladenosine biosynthesis protein TsaE
MKETYKVKSVEETWQLAREFDDKLSPGDVVCLEGDLGAGKTTFTQGLVSYLGAKRAVTSPTFCLVVEHPPDKFLLVHMDLYRLHDGDDVLTIGWEDYLQRGAVLFVEWSERAGSLIPNNAWHVSLTHGEDIDERTISFSREG